MSEEKFYKVQNRSSSVLVYSIPEDGIRREFMPGEVKNISFEELQKLSYQRGGDTLINNYLLIQSPEVQEKLNVSAEPEYYMTEKDIIELIKTGSIDAFLDCLDFAPKGVIELLKDLCVKLPVNDYEKRKALKEKIGFDVDSALANIEPEKEEAAASSTKVRRVKTDDKPTGRRTESKYKVIKKEE